MIAIVDYGVGNLRSVQKAFEHVGAEAVVTSDVDQINSADKIVLPGVGAMQPAYDKLESLNLIDPIKQAVESGKPFLGICVGFQLLFERSDEGGGSTGLGILKGSVKRFESEKIPQMGWNKINVDTSNAKLFKGIDNGSFVYFCHSYYAAPEDTSVTSTLTDYGINYCSSVTKDNIYGVQFHPEKSQEIGLNILKNFTEL